MEKSRVLLIAALPLLLLAGCGKSSAPSSKAPRSASTQAVGGAGSQPLGKRTKTRNCHWNLPLQDEACTPGAVFPTATKAAICVPGYSRRVRHVSSSTKRAVYREYGITSHTAFQYEVDHLVSLELGGSNSIANLWPEPASPTPGFHEKDMVENYLHDQVCSGKMRLSKAQDLIAHNWIAVYHQMGH